MDFDAMASAGPAAKKRFCAECKKHVHDLSKMSKREARALLEGEATEGLCIRYLYDARGDVVFADDAKLVAASALNRAKRFVTAAVALAMPISLTACMGAYVPKEKVALPQQVEPKAEPASPSMPVAGDAGPGASTPVAK